MTVTREMLADKGLDMDPGEFVALVYKLMPTLPSTRVRPEHRLTESERRLLSEGGFDLTSRVAVADDPEVQTQVLYAELLAAAGSAKQVAARLQVSDAAIRQRLGKRQLYGVKVRNEWRLPSFQFDGDRVVDHFADVSPALSPDLHPVEVLLWFITPTADLPIRGRDASPRQWLLSGGKPEPVIALAQNV
ncbi:MAG: DNA-binding protein [Thermomicrobiales bacterium]